MVSFAVMRLGQLVYESTLGILHKPVAVGYGLLLLYVNNWLSILSMTFEFWNINKINFVEC